VKLAGKHIIPKLLQKGYIRGFNSGGEKNEAVIEE
jgi:hypothetical protein